MSMHQIDILRLYRLFDASKVRRVHATSRQTITAYLAEVLLDKGPDEDRDQLDAHRAFMRQIYNDGRTAKSGFRSRIVPALDADIEAIFAFFEKNGVENFGNLKDFRNHIYARNIDIKPIILPSGSIADREIEIVANGEGVLRVDFSAHPPVGDFVDVRVDRVLLLQHAADGTSTKAVERHFIRISPPNRGQGAVILPVDEATGRVLLVSQFRHPQRKWMTELPRGFADADDLTPKSGAKRELGEETGFQPKTVHHRWFGEIDAMIALRELYTDSGKLTENPAYFLAFVDADAISETMRRTQPLMENPVWVDLRSFYQAALTGASDAESTIVQRIEFFDRHFKPKTSLDGNNPVLEIEDAFTTNAANLAKPILLARYPDIANEIIADDRDWADAQLRRLGAR